MEFLEIVSLVLNILLAICAIGLIAVVLVQKTKSGGLGTAFGGEAPSFGARGRAASRESKLQVITVVLSIIVGLIAIALLVIDQFIPEASSTTESFIGMLMK